MKTLEAANDNKNPKACKNGGMHPWTRIRIDGIPYKYCRTCEALISESDYKFQSLV